MTLFKNIRVMDPASGRDEVTDMLVEGATIQKIAPLDPCVEAEVFDGTGLVAAPGLIDMHVHFRDPGQTHKEDLSTGAAAALRGGFTTVLCMANTIPPIDSPAAFRAVAQRQASAPLRILQAACVTQGMEGTHLTDMQALHTCGAALFSDDGKPLCEGALALEAMQEAARLGTVLSLHEEDPTFIGVSGVNDGFAAACLHVRGASALAEETLVARDCLLALQTGARVHIQHISSGRSVELVRLAQAYGAQVSAEATPHHFSLCEEDVARYGTQAKMNPPLRTRRDREQIIDGLADGVIAVIATDHAPHTSAEKAMPFLEAPSGIIGLETALALGITHLVMTSRLKLMTLLRKMTVEPARLCAPGMGELCEGGRAEVVIFDPRERWRVNSFASKSANSPFAGQTLTGRVHYTLCGGKIHTF